MMKRNKVFVIMVAVAFLMAFIITFQAITIHNTTKEQEEQFLAHIAVAAQSFGEYKETGYAFMYDDALMELHSASSIALLLEDDDAYKGLHGVLLSIVGTHHTFPEDLALFTDEIVAALNNFAVHHDAENLYSKLNVIDNRLTAMMMERTKKIE